MTTIGIVGSGISGLHLALKLQQEGVSSTLYSERTPEEIAASRPVNAVIRFEHTRARERELGVAHWNDPGCGWPGVRLSAIGELPLGFVGRLDRPAESVDFRIYLPRLMADYAERGGVLEYLAPDAESVTRLAAKHDLVVVASGRRSVAELFPRDPVRSPFSTPQRILTVGFYQGLEPLPESMGHFQLCPGVGEILCPRFQHADGFVHVIGIEAIPGGPLEFLSGLSYDDDPAGFIRQVCKALAEHAPELRERVNEREFDLARPNDLLQGGITPTVRTGWTALAEGTYAVAVGDAWVVNDPIVGQGANLASHSAFTLADAILAGPPFDESFCRRVEREMWKFAEPATAWSNAFLAPPPQHVVDLLLAANEDPRIANGFINNFNDPVKQWDVLGTPEGTAAWLKGFDREDSE